MNWATKEMTAVCDIVRYNADFPGIFSHSFPQNCWSNDDKRILLTTQWRNSNRIILFNVETKQMTCLNNSLDSLSSSDVLNVQNDWITASYSTYDKPRALMIAKLPKSGSEEELIWHFCDERNGGEEEEEEEEEEETKKKVQIELLKFEPKNRSSKYSNVNFEAVLVRATQSNGTLVVFPHGGPHSGYGSEYSVHVEILYTLGYSVLLINYRGSSGYGQDMIECLPGHAGEYDVEDCQQAAEHSMKVYGFKNAVLYGGSHGGFVSPSFSFSFSFKLNLNKYI
jgi:acylaminoacyl-peptidase